MLKLLNVNDRNKDILCRFGQFGTNWTKIEGLKILN